ncbi:hypothetical protein U1Q18_039843 [Sarracenia purpurea var. burkii]
MLGFSLCSAIAALGPPGYVYLLWEGIHISRIDQLDVWGLAFALSLAAPRWLLPLLVLVWGGLAASQSCLGAWFILQLALCLGLGDLSLFGVVPQRVLSCCRGSSVEVSCFIEAGFGAGFGFYSRGSVSATWTWFSLALLVFCPVQSIAI